MKHAGEQGQLFLVSAPSGAGKTSLVTRLVDMMDNLSISISHTTRTRRTQEADGENYYFVSVNKFEAMLKAGEFLEHAVIFGNRYGTCRATVVERLNQGQDVILEIDWQGARQVRNNFPSSVSIFVLPPSKAALTQRLKSRAQDKPEVIKTRTAQADKEMSHYSEFDYLVINDDFDQACLELKTIVDASRLRLSNQEKRHAELIQDLLGSSLES